MLLNVELIELNRSFRYIFTKRIFCLHIYKFPYKFKPKAATGLSYTSKCSYITSLNILLLYLTAV